ncbi:MAG: uracil-DNA glycosylase [Vicinamibacterales bacterium]
MTPVTFVAALEQVSLPSVFNPYSDVCPEHDHATSAAIRRSNLLLYLQKAADRGIDSVWLGRDCGYRGARRTGIALTDERQLAALAEHFSIHGLEKATAGDIVAERTATEVWKMIRELRARTFLWNVFPFHPYDPQNPMSNRPHRVAEFREAEDILAALLDWLRPRVVVTLGNDAARAAARLGLKSALVRHPSYGGHLEFARALRCIYGERSKASATN